jgi:site-specific DNA-adenine methylase
VSKLPAFQYPGGKARLREWLVPFFPRVGRTYLEPFAGRGNVFFKSRSVLKFARWQLNDLNTASFFRALREVDVRDLPDRVDQACFDRMKLDWSDTVARVVEPRVRFFGVGGFKGVDDVSKRMPGGGGKDVYSGRCYRMTVLRAQRLLRAVEVTGAPWETLPWGTLDHRDFVYLDPPYFDCADVGYGEIDHEALVGLLQGARFRWALSGYDSALYRQALGTPSTRERTASMRSPNAGGKRADINVECLWTNVRRSA